MIKLKTAILTDKAYSDAYLACLEEELNESYTIDVELVCHINIEDEDNTLTIRAIYNHEKGKQVIEESCQENPTAIMSLMKKIVPKYKKIAKCKHTWVRPKTTYGDEIPDGRAVCENCGFKSDKELEKLPNKTLVKMSGSSEYVAKYDWRDIFIQGGEGGLVYRGKESYNTAFIEVFPTIDGYSTFIRGEGKTVREAEENTKEKFEKSKTCKKHEFSRKVRGYHRGDGCGVCIHCGLFSTTALPPETTCMVCGAPSKETYKDGHICLEHYYSLNVKDAIEDETRQHKKWKKEFPNMSFNRDESDFYIKWKKEWEFRFIKFLQEHLDMSLIVSNYETIKDLISHMHHLLSRNLYTKGTKILSKSRCPENESEEVIKDVFDLWTKNIEKILKYIQKEEKEITNNIIYPEKHKRK